MKDVYYSRPEISNSDLSELYKYFHGSAMDVEPVEAYKFGNLIDAMLTEPAKVDYFNYTCGDDQLTKAQFDQAYKMLQAARKDQFLGPLLPYFEGQMMFNRPMEIQYGTYRFTADCRCKYDLYNVRFGWGGDIKSTAATSQKQFEEACRHFNYDRQRAFYMDISGAKKDILIGISKENFKVFKLPIDRDSQFYKDGHEAYSELAFQWHMLFHEFNNAA